jgi:hypothetical protein
MQQKKYTKSGREDEELDRIRGISVSSFFPTTILAKRAN